MPPIAVVIYIGFHFTIIGEKYFNYDLLAPLVSGVALSLPPLGFLLAIIATIRKNRKLLFPIMGLAFNLATILLEVIFIIVMKEIG